MSEISNSKSSASTFATVLIGLIILAFMFTGYNNFENGGVAHVGSVGGEPITPEEYNQEYKRQLDFFKQYTGGAELSTKQIEAFKIKESTVKNLVQRKLMVKFAKDLGTFPSDEAVKAEIKALPYFQTNGQFDITRYKGLLEANRLTPMEFEQSTINQLRMKDVQDLASQFPLSKNYLEDLNKFRQDKVNAEIVQISKHSLAQFIEVSPAELKTFLAVPTNEKRIGSMFKERQESLNKPEEVTARHILLLSEGKKDEDVKAQIEKIAKEVTTANFAAKANQYTEDPSGKGKGGELGSFARGRMVPEFEKVAFEQKIGTISAPVKTAYGYHIILVEKKTPAVVAKIENYRETYAKDIIQKDKVEDLKKLTVSIANDMRKALESGNEAAVKALVAKYKLQYSKATVNRLDGVSNGTLISADNMKQLFSNDLTKPQFNSFDDGANMIMIRTTPGAVAVDAAEQTKVASDNASLKTTLARKMMENILKQLEANTKVKINDSALRM